MITDLMMTSSQSYAIEWAATAILTGTALIVFGIWVDKVAR